METSSSIEKLQKTNKLNELLPYAENLPQCRQFYLQRLKRDLSSAVLCQDQSLVKWITNFNHYLTTFDLAFTKEDHVLFIKFCLQSLFTSSDYKTMNDLCLLLGRLIEKFHLLNRDDLQIEWRPLHNLLEKVIKIKREVVFETEFSELRKNLRKLFFRASPYFTKEATAEMLAEWKQYLCIYSPKIDTYLRYCYLFFPVQIPPEEHEFGFKLWFEQFFNFWIKFANNSALGSTYLFAILAKHANGFIDWEPYLPTIFHNFESVLTDTTKKYYTKVFLVEVYSYWIVYMISPSSQCLRLLDCFFRQRSSRFENVNSDIYLMKIINDCLQTFFERLDFERYRSYWYKWTPNSHRLTDENIAQFSLIMLENLEKLNWKNVEVKIIHQLCQLAPETMADKITMKLELANGLLSEPTRLVSALELFSLSLLPLVSDSKVGIKYRSQLPAILNGLVNSINTNNQTLCFLQFLAIRSITVLGLPLQDGSHLLESESELDQYTAQMLLDTRLLDDFAIEFVNCCFTVIESNNEDLFKMKKYDFEFPKLFKDTFICILTNVSHSKAKRAVEKVLQFASSHILENEKCIDLLNELLSACWTITNHQQEKFLLTLFDNIHLVLDKRTKLHEICKSELIYYVKLLHVCFSLIENLHKYQDKIIELFEALFQVEYDNEFPIMSTSLRLLLANLVQPKLLNESFTNALEHQNSQSFSLSHYMNWPSLVPIEQIKLKWKLPSTEDLNFARILYKNFIKKEMTRLEEWTNSHIELSKAQLEMSLSVLLIFNVLHEDVNDFKYVTQEKFKDSFVNQIFDGESLTKKSLSLAIKIVNHLKSSLSNNANLLYKIELIIYRTLKPYMSSKYATSDFDTFKKANKYSLQLRHRYTDLVWRNLVDLHRKKMSACLREMAYNHCGQLQTSAIEPLLYLSTCSVKTVRKDAQSDLLALIKEYPYAAKMVYPQLIENLKNGVDENLFIGTMDLLINTKTFSLMFNGSHWDSIKGLWLALLETNYVQNPHLFNLLNFQDISSWLKNAPITMPIEKQIVSNNFLNLFEEASKVNFNILSSQKIHVIEQCIIKENQENNAHYQQLIKELVNVLVDRKLHWRFYEIAFTLLASLIRADQPFPQEAIQFYLDSLVHESIYIRKFATVCISKILFSRRPSKKIVTIESLDYSFAQLSLDCISNKNRFEETTGLDKYHVAFYEVPYTLRLPTTEFTQLDFIAHNFVDQYFLDKFFELNSMNEKSENINTTLVCLWKTLFQTYKLFNSDLIFSRVEDLLNKNKCECDKLAVEILISLVKASSWFGFDDFMKLTNFLKKIFHKHLLNFNSESKPFWQSLFDSIYKNHDIRRFSWILDYLNNNSFFTDTTPIYYQAVFLNFLVPALKNNWKYPQTSNLVLQNLEKNLDYDYDSVRISIAKLLSKMFHFAVGVDSLEHHTNINGSTRQEFVKRLESKLAKTLSPLFATLNSDSTNDVDDTLTMLKSTTFDQLSPESKKLHNLMETIVKWISYSLTYSITSVCKFHFIPLLPYLCLVNTNNPSLQQSINSVVCLIGSQSYDENEIDSILNIIIKLSNNWNWHTRQLVLYFVYNFFQCNVYLLSQNADWIDSIVKVVCSLLSDDVIEVRELACRTLSSQLSRNILSADQVQTLIDEFKTRSSHKVRKVQSQNDSMTILTNHTGDLIHRHSGILGLCAFVRAYPDELPDILPDILLFLSYHLSDPSPIPKSIQKTFSDFKKYHLSDWVEYKRKFTSDQLSELVNVLVSPSYYA